MSNNASGRPLQFDPSLLQPIVRSKRTPIACTECRRRQVKCSGTTPRCERCMKKNIECAYMSLSDQRTGGSISRSGTPAHGQASQSRSHLGSSAAAAGHTHGHGHGHGHSSSRLSHSSASQLGWQATSQGYSTTGSGYPAASQGWQADSPGSSPVSQFGANGMQPNQNQAYAGVPMAFPNGYGQQAAYPGQGTAGQGGDMYTNQGYAAQQGFAGGASYDAYGHAVSAADPGYAYQMAAMAGDDSQSAVYMGQFSQQQTQVFFDPTSGQMISADVATQWAENPNAAFQGQSYSGRN